LLANPETEKTYGSLNCTVVERNDYGCLALDFWSKENARRQTTQKTVVELRCR
jgi:hypothetical protein